MKYAKTQKLNNNHSCSLVNPLLHEQLQRITLGWTYKPFFNVKVLIPTPWDTQSKDSRKLTKIRRNALQWVSSRTRNFYTSLGQEPTKFCLRLSRFYLALRSAWNKEIYTVHVVFNVHDIFIIYTRKLIIQSM